MGKAVRKLECCRGSSYLRTGHSYNQKTKTFHQDFSLKGLDMLIESFRRKVGFLAVLAAMSPMVSGAAVDAPVAGNIWPAAEGVVQLHVGAIDVAVIEDRKTVFNQALFEGIEKYPERLALLPGGKAPGVVKSFLVRSGDRLALIDSGYGAAFGGFTAERLAQMGVKASDITDVLLTHLDGDHIGGLSVDGKALFPKAVLHLSQAEYDGWIVKGDARAQKSIDRAREVFALYGDRVKPFAVGEEVLPGVTARDAKGHTIGHVRYDLDSNNAGMSIVGDLLHAYPLQMRFTAMSSKYDQDPVQAAVTREATLDELSSSGRFVSGMHVAPMGWIVKRQGGYDFLRFELKK